MTTDGFPISNVPTSHKRSVPRGDQLELPSYLDHSPEVAARIEEALKRQAEGSGQRTRVA